MAARQWTLLGIALGNKCNMLCEHCLPSSSIHDDSALSIQEEKDLVTFIDTHKIPLISFTGGEPVLFYSASMLRILEGLRFRPRVRITSNGSFAKKMRDWDKLLLKLGPNELRISYDRFHAKFLKLEVIKDIFDFCSESGIRFIIETCISEPKDLIDLYSYPSWFKDSAKIDKVLRAGRAKATGCFFRYEVFESENLNVRCPFIEAQQLMFYPNKGFSFCCNSLAANQTIPKERLYFANVDQMLNSPIYQELESVGPLKNLLKMDPSLQSDPDNSDACNLCDSYFTKTMGT